jgi:tetratricopeptide (TPR) repeat protein
MKHLVTIVLILFSIQFSLSQSDNPKDWDNFIIYVNASDDPLFVELSNDLGLGIMNKDELDIEYSRGQNGDYVLGGRYQLLVNLTDKKPSNRYMIVGDYTSENLESDRRASRYSWEQLSRKTQNGLLNWTQDNKVNNKNRVGKENAEDPNNPSTWTYFRILARAEDDSLFIRLQDDMGIDPKLESYSITINITDPESRNQFIVLGDETDPNSFRYDWNQISPPVQNGLVKWTGTNKENLGFNKKYYKEKLALYNELMKLNPKYRKMYYLYFLRGQACSKLQDYDNALVDYNKSIDLNDEFSKSYAGRGSVFYAKENYKQALKDYNRALELDPDNPQMYGSIGNTYMNMSKYKEAISAFEKAIKLNPTDFRASEYEWTIKNIKEYYLKK